MISRPSRLNRRGFLQQSLAGGALAQQTAICLRLPPICQLGDSV